jgi:hypothetical protein
MEFLPIPVIQFRDRTDLYRRDYANSESARNLWDRFQIRKVLSGCNSEIGDNDSAMCNIAE